LEWDKKCSEIIGGKKSHAVHDVDRKDKIKSEKNRPLKGFFPNGKAIYATYQGKDYKAWVFRNGKIKYSGHFFINPSPAGRAVTKKKALNGWKFWKYKNKDGELDYIDAMRK
jgi:hypothetical protein